jgi:hypothetical protein
MDTIITGLVRLKTSIKENMLITLAQYETFSLLM